MHSHSTIDSRWCGIPTSYRSWHRASSSDWHFEWSSRWRYVSIGFDIFDEEDDISVHFAVPFLWLSLNVLFKWECVRALRKRFRERFGYGGREISLRYNDAAFWWTCFANDDHSRKDPWWQHGSIYMPWHPQHIFTEILSIDLRKVVFREESGKRLGWPEGFQQRQKAEAANSLVATYTYVRNNGERQERVATVHVERMGHGYRWLRYPFHVRTSIWVSLNGEIGESTGSWKGGTTGFGTTLRRGERVIDALRRMENERRFDR